MVGISYETAHFASRFTALGLQSTTFFKIASITTTIFLDVWYLYKFRRLCKLFSTLRSTAGTYLLHKLTACSIIGPRDAVVSKQPQVVK